MGTYQNYAPSPRMEATRATLCPRCAQPKTPQGVYFSGEVPVPLNLRLFFISITVQLKVTVSYCPRCGFLKVEVSKT